MIMGEREENEISFILNLSLTVCAKCLTWLAPWTVSFLCKNHISSLDEPIFVTPQDPKAPRSRVSFHPRFYWCIGLLCIASVNVPNLGIFLTHQKLDERNRIPTGPLIKLLARAIRYSGFCRGSGSGTVRPLEMSEDFWTPKVFGGLFLRRKSAKRNLCEVVTSLEVSEDQDGFLDLLMWINLYIPISIRVYVCV